MARDPLADVVHDLRTPLAVVAGFAELLERRADVLTADQRAEYVARIAAGARQMDELLEAAQAAAAASAGSDFAAGEARPDAK